VVVALAVWLAFAVCVALALDVALSVGEALWLAELRPVAPDDGEGVLAAPPEAVLETGWG
jgi:hypothetical protein